MSNSSLLLTIQNLPNQPGVYQYFNKNNKLLYIGKAKSLNNRVKSYWRFQPDFRYNPTLSTRITMMLQESTRLEYIVVENEEDALILENSLIKQLKPKYNILLRDDKTYPYIYIDESTPFPRFEYTRKVVKGKNITYYGPFPTGGKALFDALYEVFPLVQKKSCLSGGEACLFYQIDKCLAPCEERVTPEHYATIIESAKKAILKRKPLLEHLEGKMIKLATQERFEEAAKMRDSLEKIKSLNISSTIDLANGLNIDIFAIINGDSRGVIVKLFMRDGKVISSSHSYFRQTHVYDANDAYKQALLEFYHIDTPNISSQILTAHNFDDSEELAATLSDTFGKKISITTPQRGSKAKLISLAVTNARELLSRQSSENIIEQRVADLLYLDSIPYRVEVFDNSHMMGVASVGAMVVWDEENWDKSSYRRYELESKDEYAQMREMLTRRINSFDKEPPPDLWVLDGGKANLNLAISLLQEHNVNLNVVAIAKEKLDSKAHRAKGSAKDLIYTEREIIELMSSDKRLQWLQRLRDESHRFAITYHQNKKRRSDTQLSLLNKKGIGKATIQKLISYFGTFEAIEKASFEEIELATNKRIAKAIKIDS